jgi:chemotaxis response regulator CheB
MNSKKKPAVKSVSTKLKKCIAQIASPQPGFSLGDTQRMLAESALQDAKEDAENSIGTAKKKSRGSADEATRRIKGGRRSKVTGKSTLPETNFPIVGIGESAGGFEALEVFLANLYGRDITKRKRAEVALNEY